MRYEVEFRPSARRDLRRLPKPSARRVLGKIARMCDNLFGDVKHLAGTDAGYRLRVGDYRVLFDLDGARIIVRRIRHRRDAY